MGAEKRRDRQTVHCQLRRWPASSRALPWVTALLAAALTLLVRHDGPLPGESAVTLWLYRNTPGPIDLVGDLLDPLVADLTAPLVFFFLFFVAWWRWGRHAAIILGVAGGLTGLTRVGDLVERPRPTASGSWSSYAFGNGGYPSGHVVFTLLVLGTVTHLSRRHSSQLVARHLTGLTIVLLVLTCWTRVSSLAHWPLDVVGGLLMAATALAAVLWFSRSVDALTSNQPLLRSLLGLPRSATVRRPEHH